MSGGSMNYLYSKDVSHQKSSSTQWRVVEAMERYTGPFIGHLMAT